MSLLIQPEVRRKDIVDVKKDARRWKVISIILFFVGIGAGWLLSILL